MASETSITQVREGMTVHTADGTNLGKVTRIWYGTDPTANTTRCDEEICSRIEVHHRNLLKDNVLYIPYHVVGEIDSNNVRLSIDAATVYDHDWRQRPRWLGQEPDKFRGWPAM